MPLTYGPQLTLFKNCTFDEHGWRLRAGGGREMSYFQEKQSARMDDCRRCRVSFKACKMWSSFHPEEQNERTGPAHADAGPQPQDPISNSDISNSDEYPLECKYCAASRSKCHDYLAFCRQCEMDGPFQFLKNILAPVSQSLSHVTILSQSASTNYSSRVLSDIATLAAELVESFLSREIDTQKAKELSTHILALTHPEKQRASVDFSVKMSSVEDVWNIEDCNFCRLLARALHFSSGIGTEIDIDGETSIWTPVRLEREGDVIRMLTLKNTYRPQWLWMGQLGLSVPAGMLYLLSDASKTF